jgi:hypothetical protein
MSSIHRYGWIQDVSELVVHDHITDSGARVDWLCMRDDRALTEGQMVTQPHLLEREVQPLACTLEPCMHHQARGQRRGSPCHQLRATLSHHPDTRVPG